MPNKSRLYDIAGLHVHSVTIPEHLAATATEEFPIFIAPDAAPEGVRIASVQICCGTLVTGVDTNTTHINLINKGTDGTGTTELGNRDLVATPATNLTAGDVVSLYAPATKLAVATGVVLALELEKVGTGLLVPALLVSVAFEAQ